MRRLGRLVAASALVGVGVMVACEPIVGTPPVPPPTNRCPEHACETYVTRPGAIASTCDAERRRCEVPAEPSFRITIVVHVPDSSYDAPGETFIASGDQLFSRQPTSATDACQPRFCLPLPRLYGVTGSYRVNAAMAKNVGVNAADQTSFPIHVTFIPVYGPNDTPAVDLGLPLGPLFASSRLVRTDATGTADVLYQLPLPEGRYIRFAYPEEPFDEALPPGKNTVSATGAGTTPTDSFVLGPDTDPPPPRTPETPLDDPSGALRRATISRAEGLDGFRAWLAESSTGWRISSRRSLRGTRDVVRLDTAGQSLTGDQSIDVVVAPPEGSIALPRLQSTLFSGAGLESIDYPALPGAATVGGLISIATPSGLAGIPSRVSFTSTSIRALDGTPQQILRYQTTVSTDEAGGFTTVLPIGTYDVLFEPAEGTGFSTTLRREVEIGSSSTALALSPKRRTQVSGRVVLADGRALSQAEVSAIPSDADAVGLRPQRSVTASDGSFAFELDEGRWDFRVDPALGTGFPRLVVTSREVSGERLALGFLSVPPPTRLAFTIKVPGQTANPVVSANVRIFAERPSTPNGAPNGSQWVEVGMGLTDQDGACEILLAGAPN